MQLTDIPTLRLSHLGVSAPLFTTPRDVVSHLLALQAQDYAGAVWAIGLRLPNAKVADIEQAISDKQIIRTWPMRGTLHFVAADDIYWMLELLTPRVIVKMKSRRAELELDDSTLHTSYTIIQELLSGGKISTREEILQTLESQRISTAGQRGYHILCNAAMSGLICFGPRKEKAQTFVLLSEWAPQKKPFDRDEALQKLTYAYFASHGPATIMDCMGWSGLPSTDIKRGLELNNSALTKVTVDEKIYYMKESQIDESEGLYLLPGFDEYILGYKERASIISPEIFQKIVPGGNGMFMPTIVSHGKIVGMWKRKLKKKSVEISQELFTNLSEKETQLFDKASSRYAEFLSLKKE